MKISVWADLITSLFDRDARHVGHLLPGADVREWLLLVQADYDDVDRHMIDAETIGGG